MAKNKRQRKKKLPSTKELEGQRVNGVLYLKKGVGSNQFWNVHADGGIGGVEQHTSGAQNQKRSTDYD